MKNLLWTAIAVCLTAPSPAPTTAADPACYPEKTELLVRASVSVDEIEARPLFRAEGNQIGLLRRPQSTI